LQTIPNYNKRTPLIEYPGQKDYWGKLKSFGQVIMSRTRFTRISELII